MKFYIQQVHKEQIEIDIPQDTTLEQLRQLLISQYSYPDLPMKFINNGNILEEPNGLMNVKELGRIIVYIKYKSSKKSHKRSKKIHTEQENNKEQEENNADVENKPENEAEQQDNALENLKEEQEVSRPKEIETEVSNESSNNNENSNENINNEKDSSKNSNENNDEQIKYNDENNNIESNENQYQEPFELSNAASIYFENPQNIADLPKEQLDFYLSDCFKKIHLKQLYDERCNFYSNLNETSRIAEMIHHNPGLMLVVNRFTEENFSIALQRNTIDLDFAMELAGFVPSSIISLADEYEAKYAEMPTIYTQAIKRLMKKYNKRQREVVKAFIDANYDEQGAEILLQG